MRLLYRVARGEGHSLPYAQLAAIYEKTEGKPRAALQLLEKVLAVDPAVRDAIVASAEVAKEQVAVLARALMNGRSWKYVAQILSGIEEDNVESVRRGLLAYSSRTLLRGVEDDRAMEVLDQMVEPFFASGLYGLVHACYLLCKQ